MWTVRCPETFARDCTRHRELLYHRGAVYKMKTYDTNQVFRQVRQLFKLEQVF